MNKRLRPKNLHVWLNLARFINKSGNFEINENMDLSATFDVFERFNSPEKATASVQSLWAWIRGGGLLTNLAL